MALEYCVLASGSSGNCLWVKGGGVEVLVDLGLSFAALGQRLAVIGRTPSTLAAVFCSHFHGDHIGGVRKFVKDTGAPVYATERTLRALRGVPEASQKAISQRDTVRVGGLVVSTAPTPHDAPGSVCFSITDGEARLGVVTDLGRSTDAVVGHLAGVDGLVIELNHDPEMLENGPYPNHLKKRIRGDWGHLSNAQGAELLSRLAHEGLQHVTLAHLSETNNTPALAQQAAEETLGRARGKPQLVVADQWKPGDPVRLRPRRGAQLSLF